MNVMSKAHAYARKAIAQGAIGKYAALFAFGLKQAHKAAKLAAREAQRFIIKRFVKPGQYEAVDIRNLPTFEASKGIYGDVSHWSIKGSVKTDECRYTEAASGYHAKTLKGHLAHWADAVVQGYKELCLMLEIDGKLYRLIK